MSVNSGRLPSVRSGVGVGLRFLLRLAFTRPDSHVIRSWTRNTSINKLTLQLTVF